MTTSFDIYLAKSPLFIAIGAFLILAASESFENRELVQDAMAHLLIPGATCGQGKDLSTYTAFGSITVRSQLKDNPTVKGLKLVKYS
ncbi:hypothetical protein DTO063F5_8905 [Paecilomyces variotii]|nr:hypothetical protein DTO063F5_8905 [Paecilomyces variotii]